jgi:hypothetical protein
VGISPAWHYDPERIVSLHELVGGSVAVEEVARVLLEASAIGPGTAPDTFSSVELARARDIVGEHATAIQRSVTAATSQAS